MIFLRAHRAALVLVCALGTSLASCASPQKPAAQAASRFNGQRALSYTSQFIAASGPRWVGGEGHARAEAFLEKHFAHDQLVKDTFTTSTPIGLRQMTNFIVKFPGRKNGIVVVAGHYDTNYPLRDTGYVGANDGGSSTGLLMELANHLRGHVLPGYSVWLVFTDGEEAFQSWSESDSDYGSRHLAAKWQNDGTLKRVKAFLLVDMIGDRNYGITRDTNSTPWLIDLVRQAAAKYGYQKYFFQTQSPVDDDHRPFYKRGVPSIDLIDFNSQGSFWHTPQDTMDKLSAQSFTITGDVVLETIRLIDERR